MPCGPLIEFRETGTHSRVCNVFHMSTFPGRGVTSNLESPTKIVKEYKKNKKQKDDTSNLESPIKIMKKSEETKRRFFRHGISTGILKKSKKTKRLLQSWNP